MWNTKVAVFFGAYRSYEMRYELEVAPALGCPRQALPNRGATLGKRGGARMSEGAETQSTPGLDELGSVDPGAKQAGG